MALKQNRRKSFLNKKHQIISFKSFLLFLAIFLSILSQDAATSYVSYTATISMNVKSQYPYYLHRTDILAVTPIGKLMNTASPPLNQSEIRLDISRSETVYFYTPELSSDSLESGTWVLYLWASTASSGKVSRLTVRIHLVSSDGSVEKTLIGSITDYVVDYGYSERIITVFGSEANITSTDRIRLTLYVQAGPENDPKGMNFYYDGYGSYQTLNHETRLEPP